MLMLKKMMVFVLIAEVRCILKRDVKNAQVAGMENVVYKFIAFAVCKSYNRKLLVLPI